jgi:hypothetical protein
MNAVPRVIGFVAGCAALFAVALGIGRWVGPVAADPVEADHDGMSDGSAEMAGHDTEQEAGHEAGHDVGGLGSSADGYTLGLDEAQSGPGRQRVAFTIVGPDGHSVTAYDEQHERDLHLIVVRRDLTGFQHVHPRLDETTGLWTTRVDLLPGAWRVLADFVPSGGEKVVLGADLLVPGDFTPEPLGADLLTAHVDGYDVTLGGSVVAGEETVLTATVTKDGEPVTDLQPYLGAYGHLVSLRDGDLGYLHVHPHDDTGPGPAIFFDTEFPSAGRYRLFLDFRHGGAVHTAAFTVSAEGTTGDGHDH